jgi:hypothetical protein
VLELCGGVCALSTIVFLALDLAIGEMTPLETRLTDALLANVGGASASRTMSNRTRIGPPLSTNWLASVSKLMPDLERDEMAPSA